MRSKLCEDRLNVFDLVIVDGVAHPWINPFCDNRPECAQHTTALVNALERNVWINITASKEHRGAGEMPVIVSACVFGTDQSATQNHHASIVARVPGCIFDSKAGSLGKSKKDYLIGSQMVF